MILNQPYQQATAVYQAAAQLYPVILTRMFQAGQISQMEYSQLCQLQIQQAILMELNNTYGNMAVSQAELERSLMNRISTLVLSSRARANSIPTAGGYGQPYMAVPQMGLGVAVPNPNLGGAIPASDMMGSSRPDLKPAVTSAQPTPTQTTNPVIQQQQAPTAAKVRHNNGAISFNLADGKTVASMPTRTPVETPQNTQEEHQIFGNSYQLNFNRYTVNSTEIRLRAPFTSRIAALMDFIHNNQSMLHGKFCHLLIFNKIDILPFTFTSGKDMFDKWTAMYNERTKSLTDIMSDIKGRGSVVEEAMSDLLLGQFNRAASVNFVKFGATSAQCLPKILSLADLSQMLLDSGDKYATWQENEEVFKRVMSVCLKMAFNRVFKNESKGYLDMGNPRERAYILADDRLGLRFPGGDGRQVMLQKATPEFKQELQDRLNTRFAVLVEQRILLHNLDIANPRVDDFTRKRFVGTEESNALLSMYEHYGTTELVNMDCPDQFAHPLIYGVSYDGSVVLQRSLI